MDGDGDDNDDGPSRGPGYNDNCRDDNPFDPTNRNNDPFKATEDFEEKYRNERERAAAAAEALDMDEIKPIDDDDASSVDGRGGLAVMLGNSLANSMIDGMADQSDKPLNGNTPYTTFGMSEDGRFGEDDSNCLEDCVYYGVLCCRCSIL